MKQEEEVTMFTVDEQADDLSRYRGFDWLVRGEEIEQLQSRRGPWDDGLLFVSLLSSCVT